MQNHEISGTRYLRVLSGNRVPDQPLMESSISDFISIDFNEVLYDIKYFLFSTKGGNFCHKSIAFSEYFGLGIGTSKLLLGSLKSNSVELTIIAFPESMV